MVQGRIPTRKRGELSSSPIPSSSQSSLLATEKISTLPDPILYDILNLLPTKCTARTSILSKRFNSLWLNNPVMDFNEFDHRRRNFKDTMLDRMKRCYQTHDFTFLEKLKIRGREPIKHVFDINLSTEVNKFTRMASKAKTLKEIDLQFPVSKKSPMIENISEAKPFLLRYILHETLLISFCKSLKFLRLRGCFVFLDKNMDGPEIIFPFLKELTIRYCVLPGGNYISKFIDGCPQLEKLSLKFNLPVTKIQFFSSKIKHLVLGCYCSTVIFQIVAPNLQSLRIKGAHSKYSTNGGMILQPHHIISAPNLETLCFKNISLWNEGIKLALSTFKSLKELKIYGSILKDEPNFENQNIVKLEILHCLFTSDNLIIFSSKLPQIKHMIINSCTGLKKLTICGRGFLLSVHGCPTLREIHKINRD